MKAPGFFRNDPDPDDGPSQGGGGNGSGGRGPGGGPGNRGRTDFNRRSLISVALAIAFAVLVSSVMPPPLVAATFSEICFFGALGIGVVAAIRREPIAGAPVLTGWDRAAMLLLLSQIAGLFVDHAEVEAYLRQVQQTGQF
ncbi:hypothetical protein [Caenispirillum salinarum]|uniref:hypothetical protein n=1 Tax=Caenispirillum salinarum TaxID=859058 RepID=UPI00384C71C4